LKTEKVILVDEHDGFVGEMEKMEAHEKSQLHRAVSVFVFNSKNQMLLQRRALCKYHSPGLWTNSACTHPRLNETNIEAASRRLKEEMGIEHVELTKLFDFIYKEKFTNGLTEYEFDHVFVGISDQLPLPDEMEVCDYKYIDLDKLLNDISEREYDYTVWFKKIVERVIIQFNDTMKTES